ncbi:hypothetical protein M514_01332 [Trichuris suis]|uniref:Uncharacterized protein n=1 Tax=Trichuris suis TaxID=68888 RepID=A0A085NS08_9BILA|nr:hypothetical protein M513_01332 [Trichuris suis]KFD72254.1 hypothetical protein M514_01332 [Trichuris suis]
MPHIIFDIAGKEKAMKSLIEEDICPPLGVHAGLASKSGATCQNDKTTSQHALNTMSGNTTLAVNEVLGS